MSHPNFSSAFHRLWDTAPNRRARRALGRNGSARRRARPSLETLEDRITPNATFTPTVFTDGVTGSGQVNTLRDAVLAANRDTSSGTDTIQLQAGTYTLSIVNSNGHETVGTEGDLNISNTNHTLVIQGIADVPGTPSTIIEQTAVDRVFQILAPGTTVIYKNVIIEGGQAQDEGGSGAGGL